MDYGEISQGSGAVAFLVGEKPRILQVEIGASGCYSFEVNDASRPFPGFETADPYAVT